MGRLLLIEMIAVDRFHRSLSFPFLAGHLRDEGVDLHWFRYGLDAAARSRQEEEGYGLEATDLEALKVSLGEAAPTAVVCNLEPAPSLEAFFRELWPEARLGFLQEGRTSERELSLTELPADPVALLRWVDPSHEVAKEYLSLFERVTPFFGWVAGNRAADEAPSLPFLICGEECTYRKTLRRNPFFEELDLSGCDFQGGCTFCERPTERVKWQVDPVELFAKQVQALVDTHRPWEGRLQVRAVGEPILRNIEAVARVLLERELPPMALLLDGRSDTILRVQDQLRAALKLLAGTEHRLELALVGLESFVTEELDRFNKGIGWRENLAMPLLLLELEQTFPLHFGFREHGGLSLLLFSPWTRLENLALNLAIIERGGLHQMCGKILTSRLRLRKSLPLYALAESEGLLREAYDDPTLDTAQRNFYADEHPWAFGTPGVELVSRLFLRLADGIHDARGLGALAELVTDERARGEVHVAQALVDAAIENPEASEEELITAARPYLAGDAMTRDTQEEPLEELGGEVHGVSFGPMFPMEQGIKPVLRDETEGLAEQGISLESLEAKGLTVMRRIGTNTGMTREEIFVGRDPEKVAEALRLTELMDAANDDESWRELSVKVGVLLGYPECCGTRFGNHHHFLRSSYTWLHLLNRIAAEGPVPWLLNPAGGAFFQHIPCSLECAETLKIAEAVYAACAERETPAAMKAFEARLKSPWLIFLDGQGEALQLKPEDDPRAERWRFRAGTVAGSHPLLRRASRGDTLVQDEQQLYILRDGKVQVALGGRAFVWWHEAPIQQEFYRALLALRFAPRPEGSGEQPGDVAEPASSGPSAGGNRPQPLGAEEAEGRRLTSLLTQVKQAADRNERRFGGFSLAGAAHQGDRRSRVTLERGDERLLVDIARQAPEEPAYLKVEPFGLTHPSDTPIDTLDKDRAVRAFARYFEAALRRAGLGS